MITRYIPASATPNPGVIAASPPALFSNSFSLSSDSFAKYISRALLTGGNRKMGSLTAWVKTPPSIGGAQYMITFAGLSPQDFVTVDGTGMHFFLDSSGAAAVHTTGFTPLGDTWYLFNAQWDTTQAVASDRVRLLVDGVDYTNNGSQFPALNYDTQWGAINEENGWAYNVSGANLWIIDEIGRFDGQIYGYSDVSSGGSPADLSGLTFGPQGVWIRFEGGTAATIGVDSSGNGHTFTGNNYADGDFSTDVP